MERSWADAASWYRRSADQGHPRAQYLLGRCYETGRGVEKDPARALELYQVAEDKDYKEAVEAVQRLQAAKGGRLKELWKGLRKRK